MVAHKDETYLTEFERSAVSCELQFAAPWLIRFMKKTRILIYPKVTLRNIFHMHTVQILSLSQNNSFSANEATPITG